MPDTRCSALGSERRGIRIHTHVARARERQHARERQGSPKSRKIIIIAVLIVVAFAACGLLPEKEPCQAGSMLLPSA